MSYALVASLVSFAIIGAQLMTGNGIDLLLGSVAVETQAVAWEIF